MNRAIDLYTIISEVSQSCEDPDTTYVDTNDGLRLIFRHGEYLGWKSTVLAEVPG